MNEPADKQAMKALLWNVVDPDDRYDIRKSMIARMPDHPSRFMGGHLELICLLQSAEIERLTIFLNEIKEKYLEVSRKELDRHSYEVQIKQLAEKNIAMTHNNNVLKGDNDKLREFLKRQSQELEQLQLKSKDSSGLEALRSKYDATLKELKVARESLSAAESSIITLNQSVTQWKARYERLQKSKQSELANERERVERTLKLRTQTEMKELIVRYESKISSLQAQNKYNKEQVDGKNYQIQTLLLQKDNYIKQLMVLQDKSKTKGNLEQALNDKTRELAQLNNILIEKTNQIEQMFANYQRITRDFQTATDQAKHLEEEKESLAREKVSLTNQRDALLKERTVRISVETAETMKIYENKVAMLSMQIERLNSIIQIKNKESQSRETELINLHASFSKMQMQMKQKELEKSERINVLETENKLFQENDSKLRMLTMELQRGRQDMRNKSEQLSQLESKWHVAQKNCNDLTFVKAMLQKQNANLQNMCINLQNQIQQHKEEVQRIRLQLESEIAPLKRDNQGLVNAINQLQQEKGKELAMLKNQLDKGARVMKEHEGTVKRLVEMEKQLKEVGAKLIESEQKVAGFEQSIPKMTAEIQRLHSLLVIKMEQTQKMTDKYKNLQSTYTIQQNSLIERIESQVNKRCEQDRTDLSRLQSRIKQIQAKYLQELENWNQERYQKDRYIGECVRSKENLERKMADLQKEVSSRFTQDMSRYTEEVNAREAKIKHLELELKKDGQQKELLRRDINQLQIQIQNYNRQCKDLNEHAMKFNMENEALRGEVNQFKAKIVHIESTNLRMLKEQAKGEESKLAQRDSMILSLQRQLKEISNQNQALASNQNQNILLLKQYEQRLTLLATEQTRLKNLLQRRGEELAGKQEQVNSFRQLQQQLDATRLDKESIERQVGSLRQECNERIRERDEFVRRLKALDEENSQLRMSTANEVKMRQMEEELNNLRAKIYDFEGIQGHTIAQRDELFRVSHELKDELDKLQMRSAQEAHKLRLELNMQNEELRKIRGQPQEKEMLRQELQKVSASNQTMKRRQQSHLLQLKDLQKKISEVGQNNEGLVVQLKTRIAQLERILNNTRGELKSARIQLTNVNNSHEMLEQMTQELHEKMQMAASNHQTSLIAAKKEIQRLNVHLRDSLTTNAQLKSQAEQYVVELKQLAKENNRSGEFQSRLQQKDQEIANWELKFTTIYQAYGQLYTSYHQLKAESDNFMQTIKLYEEKIGRIEGEFDNLNGIMLGYKNQNDRYKREIYELQSQLRDESLEEKNRNLSAEIDRLTEANSSLKSEVSELRIRMTDQISLEKRLQEYLALMVVLFAEVESLRERVTETEKECDIVRRNSMIPNRIDRGRSLSLRK